MRHHYFSHLGYVVLAAFRLFVLIHLQVDVDDRKVSEDIEEE